jgi:tRNA U34 5-carboxymethylaminomethyl modifying GTPase MnmE/TrmE
LQAEFNKIEAHNMEVIEGEKKELLKQLNEEILKDHLAIESKIPYLIEELEVLIAEKSVKIKQKYEKSIKKYEYKDIFDHGMIALQVKWTSI